MKVAKRVHRHLAEHEDAVGRSGNRGRGECVPEGRVGGRRRSPPAHATKKEGTAENAEIAEKPLSCLAPLRVSPRSFVFSVHAVREDAEHRAGTMADETPTASRLVCAATRQQPNRQQRPTGTLAQVWHGQPRCRRDRAACTARPAPRAAPTARSRCPRRWPRDRDRSRRRRTRWPSRPLTIIAQAATRALPIDGEESAAPSESRRWRCRTRRGSCGELGVAPLPGSRWQDAAIQVQTAVAAPNMWPRIAERPRAASGESAEDAGRPTRAASIACARLRGRTYGPVTDGGMDDERAAERGQRRMRVSYQRDARESSAGARQRAEVRQCRADRQRADEHERAPRRAAARTSRRRSSSRADRPRRARHR
jgi:hypothetical protein